MFLRFNGANKLGTVHIRFTIYAGNMTLPWNKTKAIIYYANIIIEGRIYFYIACESIN